MLIQGKTSFKLGMLKKAYLYESENYGIVIENEGHVVCVYGTDKQHRVIYCAIPLCAPKYLRKEPFVLVEEGDKVFVSCAHLKIMIDFEAGKCACDKGELKLYGSDEWGKDVSTPWLESFDVF